MVNLSSLRLRVGRSATDSAKNVKSIINYNIF